MVLRLDPMPLRPRHLLSRGAAQPAGGEAAVPLLDCVAGRGRPPLQGNRAARVAPACRHGAVRILERSSAGHLVEVRLPEEIPDIWPNPLEAGKPAPVPNTLAASLEEVDFFKTPELCQAIQGRERGRFFYCLRQTNGRLRCLDHVVPQAQSGRNSHGNLVSCCVDCNAKKGVAPRTSFSASSTASAA
jgi:HNH endonuclease